MEIWQTVSIAVVIVVGLVQWAKNVFKQATTLTWTIVFPVACFVFSAVIHYLPMWVTVGFLVWATGQLGYENLVQVAKTWIASKMKG